MNVRSFSVSLGLALLAGCAPADSPQHPPRPGQGATDPAPNVHDVVGLWSGMWEADPRQSTRLSIERVGPDGWVTGSYQFMTYPPVAVRARLEDGRFTFGRGVVFRAIVGDGRLQLERVGLDGGTARTTLIRMAALPASAGSTTNAAFAGRWAGLMNQVEEWTFVLVIDQVDPNGRATGSFQFRRSRPTPFRTVIENGAFAFGTGAHFRFNLQAGTLVGQVDSGQRIDSFVLLRQPGEPGGGAAAAASAVAAPAQPAEVPARYAGFAGRWGGVWDSNLLNTATLIVEGITPEGEITGSYRFRETAPTRFRSRIEDNAFAWGSATRFVFTLGADGRLRGERDVRGTINRTIMSRD